VKARQRTTDVGFRSCTANDGRLTATRGGPISFTSLFGADGGRAVESIVPRRTFDEVILPAATRRALGRASPR